MKKTKPLRVRLPKKITVAYLKRLHQRGLVYEPCEEELETFIRTFPTGCRPTTRNIRKFFTASRSCGLGFVAEAFLTERNRHSVMSFPLHDRPAALLRVLRGHLPR